MSDTTKPTEPQNAGPQNAGPQNAGPQKPEPQAAPAPQAEDTPAWRLIATLSGAGALAGLLIVLVFQATQPRIQAHKAEMLKRAVLEVLKQPARYDTLYVVDGRLVSELPAGADPKKLDRVFLGYDAAGEPVGFAVADGQPGFQDVIALIFGYDPRSKKVLGMKVLESKETPGLGDKIEKDMGFVSGFDGAVVPLVGVKQGTRAAENEVDMITGATISARAVIRIINDAVEKKRPLLEGHLSEASR